MKTIAKLSGLAVPTISRALGDAPDISKATKEKVRRIAAQVGYVPDRAGVRLRTGRTNVISIVMSTEHEAVNMTARLVSSVASGLRGTPYHLNMTPYFPGDDPLKPIRYIVETGSADAVIFNKVLPEDPRVDYLIEHHFPFATHGRSNRCAEHAYFDFDNRAFARVGIERLVASRRREVLMIAPPVEQSYGAEMIAGARAAADAAGIGLTVAANLTSDSGIEAIRDGVVELFRSAPAIDGLLLGSPVSAMAAVAGLEQCGRRVGRDFDVVSKDANPFLALFRDSIEIVEEDIRQAGEFLAKAAIHATRHPDEPPMQFLDIPG